jgi:hypothetical protein
LYFAWSWTQGGQTLGLGAWGVVLTGTGAYSRIGWRGASIGFVGAGLSLVPAGLGFVWSLVDRDGRAWHDRLSRTTLRHRQASAQP